MNLEILEYHEKIENGFYDSLEAFHDNSCVYHYSDENAEKGEPVDVENNDTSVQETSASHGTCETCKYLNIYFRCDCHSSHLFNRDLKYDFSCIFYIPKDKYNAIFREGD